MMEDPDSLVEAFSYEGIPIRRADPRMLVEKVSNSTAKRVLVEFGVPEQLGDSVYLRRIDLECPTFGEAARDHGSSEVTDADEMLLIGSGVEAGIILLDGDTGEVFSRWEGVSHRINSGLVEFVEFLRQTQLRMNEFETRYAGTDEGDRAELVDPLLEGFRAVDAEAMAGATDYWERVLRGVLDS